MLKLNYFFKKKRKKKGNIIKPIHDRLGFLETDTFNLNHNMSYQANKIKAIYHVLTSNQKKKVDKIMGEHELV
mgnify:CR=1 FL=1